MNLRLVGCSFRTAPVAIRERLAVPELRVRPTLAELLARFGGEAAGAGNRPVDGDRRQVAGRRAAL